KASGVLTVLQEIDKDSELGGDGAKEALANLSGMISSQVTELKKKGPSAQEQLARTSKAFSGFLDKLLDQQKKEAMPPKLLAQLAGSYSTLDNHKKAAELYGSVPEPKKDAPEADKDLYQGIRIRYVKELRLDKQIDPYKK